MQGNPALFTHRDEVEQAWRRMDSIIDAWESQNIEPQNYPSGGWGPAQADAWFERV